MSSDPRDPTAAPIRPTNGAALVPVAAAPEAEAAPVVRLALAAEDAPRWWRDPLVAALCQGPAKRQAWRAACFDSDDLALWRGGLVLSVRHVGRSFVQVLEERDGVGDPGAGPASEIPLFRAEPELAAVADADLRERAEALLGGRPLARVLDVEVTRTRRQLGEDGSALRCDLDVGEVRSSRGALPICEVALAPAAGDPSQPFRLALEVQERIALRLEPRTPAERGFEQLAGGGPRTHKARRPSAGEDATVDALLAAVVASCLVQVTSNQPAAWLGSDPEGVHQMRVGVRRLRSALAFFGAAIAERQRDALRAELRWLADALGPVRDLDVFVAEGLAPVLAARPGDGSLARLLGAAQAQRAEAQATLRDAIASPRYTQLALQLGAWLARRAWREQLLSEGSAVLFMPARGWSAAILERRHEKARRHGRRLAEASPEQRHQLRIRLKKLRYAAEFSAPLFPGRRAERYARRLARLQDALGRLNDAATAERLLDTVLAHVDLVATPGALRAAGFASGWWAHAAREEAARLPALWRRHQHPPRFW